MKHNRREFLKRSGASVAGMTFLPSKIFALKDSLDSSEPIPPHIGMVVPGIHGYASQSVAAGETNKFFISSTVPYRLSIYRLGLDAETTEQDELIHTFQKSPAQPQPIHPGSYVHVEKNLKGALKALTLECWVRP